MPVRLIAPVLLTLGFAAFAVEPAAVEIPGVQNAFRATERILSGSQPVGDAAFAALAERGVKTIVSVDGGKPDVAAARKHGIRYIHLPMGYDGVPESRVPELAKAALETSGKIFIHCHHGKHRAPAAAAVVCMATAGWTPQQAVSLLKKVGTSPDYAGLYRSAREFTAPTKARVAKVGVLPEIAETGGLVDAMVAIDEHFDALKAAQKAGWATPPGNEDASPAHQATLLWEQFRELARTPDTASRPVDYRKHTAESERAAEHLRAALKLSPADVAAADTALKAAAQSCAACHTAHRNGK